LVGEDLCRASESFKFRCALQRLGTPWPLHVQQGGVMASEFHVGSVGQGFAFPAERLRHFIASNGFGSRLATALHGLGNGEALTIRAARQRITVSRPVNGIATTRRRFRLARDIL